jgi:hypothetical protein
MVRQLAMVLALVIVAYVWVGPTLAGPTIDCGPLSPEQCAEEVQGALGSATFDCGEPYGPAKPPKCHEVGPPWPVTRISFYSSNCPGVPTVVIERSIPFLGTAYSPLC